MSKRTLLGVAFSAALALLAVAPLGVGCSKPNATPPDGSTTGLDAAGPDTGPLAPDVGTPDTGPDPIVCTYDDDCPADMRCGDNGACMLAVPCQSPANCVPADEDDQIHQYCENSTVGLGCRCVKAPENDAGITGSYCKRRLPPCAPCLDDEQCGTDPLFFRTPLHEPGKCVTLDGAKVCLEPYVKTKCGCGDSATVDGAYYCAPQGSPPTCAEGGAFLCCQADENCPPEHPLCELASGRCQDVCWYDFERQETIGCRADKVCHVDPAFLSSASANFGAGRCGAPCAKDEDCSYLRGDFVCRAETGSDKRCRPPGCLGDIECPVLSSESSNGYCERETGTCKPNCRTGEDPMTSQPFKDCKEGYVCEQATPGAEPACREMTCAEQGGAQLYCSWNEFCCGEDRDGDASTPPEACTMDAAGALAEKGKCYRAPNPPWCAPCDPQDAKSCMQAGYPTSTKDKSICMAFGPGPDGQTDRGNSCVFPCTSYKDCPKGFICEDLEVYCNSDPNICGDPARCVETDIVIDPTTTPPTKAKYCQCTTPGDPSECPALDPNPGGESGSHARCADNVAPGNKPFLHCIWTHGCLPYITACTPP